MDIDVVKEPDQVTEIIPVIKSAWGMEHLEQLVKDVVAAMRFHGGLVLLARDSGKVVGMHYSFPGYRNGRVYLYSHMTGVIQDKKYSGVGEALKLAQREWARSQGYNLVAWTFDPLMSLNANFNFNKLGVFSRTYLRNFYGSMEDSLNFGLPTDRVVAEWWNDYSKPHFPDPEDFINSPSVMTDVNPDANGDTLGLFIPGDFVSMKREKPEPSREVRFALRNAFESFFKKKYTLVSFNRKESYYTLVKNFQPAERYGRNIFED